MAHYLAERRRKELKFSTKMVIAFLSVLIVTISLTAVINALFLERYYLSQKTRVLKNAFSRLQEYESISGDAEITTDWYNESKKENLSWVIVSEEDQVWKILVGFGDAGDLKVMSTRLFGYTNGLEMDNEDTKFEILEKEATYIIQKAVERFQKIDYVEIWGVLPEGSFCMVRTPLESIIDSVTIANRFYFTIGLFMIVIGGLMVYTLTRHLSRPIRELAELSLRMANLDFDAKYQSDTNNEIDILGQNFNRMSTELEHTIRELKTANLELQKDIENKIRMDEQRREFLGNVSHELKTPIALIQGYAEGLRDNISDDEESREFYCDVIIDEAGKMNKLVRSLLTLTQLESGQDAVSMERFDLTALINGVLEKSGLMIREKEAEVTFRESEPIYVWADEFKIEEVLTNYFTNALNHLGGERKIDIHVSRVSPVKVSVFNTGTPIPEEELPRLWNKFYKVDKAHTRSYGGSGIGLSIVKAIMDSHGQECGVRNYRDGVEFWFTLDTEKQIPENMKNGRQRIQ